MDEITNADMPPEGAEGEGSADPRISPEAIWGATQGRQARPAPEAQAEPSLTASAAPPDSATGSSNSDFRTWYPTVWSPWQREGAVDERPTESVAATAAPEPEPEPEAFDHQEPDIEATVSDEDELASVASPDEAVADAEPVAYDEEPDDQDPGFTWTSPVRDHPAADAWVIAPGVPPRPEGSEEVASRVQHDEDTFASTMEAGEDSDSNEADEEVSEPAALEDDRLQEIFDEHESLAAHAWAASPASDASAVAAHGGTGVPDQWVFTAKRFNGPKRSGSDEARTSGPEPTAPASNEGAARPGRLRRRRREVAEQADGHPAEEPWSEPPPSAPSASLVGFAPQPVAAPEPTQEDTIPGLGPVETLIPERRRGGGRHRRRLTLRRTRPERQERQESQEPRELPQLPKLPQRHEPEVQAEPRELSGAGAGGAGMGPGPMADLSGSLVMGSGAGMAMSSTVRVLAIALPLAAAAIAALSYLR